MNRRIIFYMVISIVLVYVFHHWFSSYSELAGTTLHEKLSNISDYANLKQKYGTKMNREPASGNTQQNIDVKDVNFEPISDSGQQNIDINEKILNNPYYKKYGIIPAQSKKRVTLLVIISTAPRRYDRRQAIRETWWSQCKQTRNVVPECIFITDQGKPGDKYYNTTLNESNTYGDLYFQDLSGGMQFEKRYIYHIIYALLNYDFDYYLRTDDDYFLCFENILQELPIPMIPDFHWGWVHVTPTRPDESLNLFSRDVIERFMLQDAQKIRCHPFGGQMIAIWCIDLNRKEFTFRHDQRLRHAPPIKETPQIRKEVGICRNYMGIHGAYPPDMRTFWNHRGKSSNSTSNLFTNSISRSGAFHWETFPKHWRYEPKLCLDDPVWDMSDHVIIDGAYSGRQDANKKT